MKKLLLIPFIALFFTSYSQRLVTSCPGSSDAKAAANVTGGTAPYTFKWSNGETTDSVSDLSAGTYTVTATDAGGCSVTAQVIITSPPIITDTVQATICSGDGYPFNGNTYTLPGIYTADLISSRGCDSLAVLNLTVSPILHITTGMLINDRIINVDGNMGPYSFFLLPKRYILDIQIL